MGTRDNLLSIYCVQTLGSHSTGILSFNPHHHSEVEAMSSHGTDSSAPGLPVLALHCLPSLKQSPG